MSLLLTAEQRREQSIQRAIEAAFRLDDLDASLEILIAAMARMMRATNGGKPLTADAAGDLAKRLYESLKGQ